MKDPENKRGKPRAMEFVWIAIAIVCFSTALHKTYFLGFKNSYLFYIFAIVALLMYLIRRILRRFDKSN